MVIQVQSTQPSDTHRAPTVVPTVLCRGWYVLGSANVGLGLQPTFVPMTQDGLAKPRRAPFH